MARTPERIKNGLRDRKKTRNEMVQIGQKNDRLSPRYEKTVGETKRRIYERGSRGRRRVKAKIEKL